MIARAIGISLFVARMGGLALPLAFSASALAVILVSSLTRYAVRRISTRTCLAFSWAGLAWSSVWLSHRVEMEGYSLIVLGLLYVFAEVRGSLNTVYLTALSSDAFAKVDSKRPYVSVAAGAPIAGVIFGGLISIESSVISASTWMLVIAAIDILTLALSRWLKLIKPSRLSQPPKSLLKIASKDIRVRKRLARQKRKPFSTDRYRFGFAILVAMKVIVLTLVGFQWKLYAGEYLVNEERLIAYFALFYAISDVLIIGLQFSTTGWLLDRFGIGVPMKLYPILLALLGLVALFSQSPIALVIIFTVARGLNVLRRSWHDPGLVAAYTILDRKMRRETIVVVKGMIKPFAEAFAGIALLFYADRVSPTVLTSVWMFVLIPWLVAASWVAGTFERAKSSDQSIDATPCLRAFTANR